PFSSLFSAPSHEGHACRRQGSALDQVRQRFTDKNVALIVRPQGLATKHGRAATRVEKLHWLTIERGRWSTDGEQTALIAGVHDSSDGGGRSQIGVTDQVALLQHHLSEWNCVPGRKSIAPVIARQAELAQAGYSFDRSRVWSKAKIATANGCTGLG